MRGACVRWRCLGVALLGLWGCQTSQPSLKPPTHEEYILPPADDPRFSLPPNFPKEVLDSGTPKKELPKPGEQFRGPGSANYGQLPGSSGF